MDCRECGTHCNKSYGLTPRLAYLAYERLMATGTVDEVIHGQQLITYAVTGPDLSALSQRLRTTPGVGQITPFGNTIHVTGRNDAALVAALAVLGGDSRYQIERIDATLEDVFISLMNDATDNFQ